MERTSDLKIKIKRDFVLTEGCKKRIGVCLCGKEREIGKERGSSKEIIETHAYTRDRGVHFGEEKQQNFRK